MGRVFGPDEAKRYYDGFGAWQDAQVYENRALDVLVTRGDFGHASSVFEVGCGTGRIAARLLEEHLGESATYAGIDISATMVGISRRRLAPWRDRATVEQADGTKGLPFEDGAFDRVVMTYVLDLLPEAAISALLKEAARILRRNGRLCIALLTEGTGPVTRLICSTWKRAYALNPALVGGCRPLRAGSLIDSTLWRVEYQEVVSSWGICSEICIAAREGD